MLSLHADALSLKAAVRADGATVAIDDAIISPFADLCRCIQMTSFDVFQWNLLLARESTAA